MKRVRAVVAHQIPRRAAIQLAVGEKVVVGDRDQEWPEFVFVTKADGGSGWVPGRYLSQASGSAVVSVEYDTTELPTEAGDLLQVIREDAESGWLWCESDVGRQGWVPAKTVEHAD